MIKVSHKNWLTNNILDRYNGNKTLDYKVQIKPYKTKKGIDTLEDAFLYTYSILEKEKKDMYILFSGGADSEYLVRSFHKHTLPFTPIIMMSSFNKEESYFGLKVCKELNITPVVLEYTEDEWFQMYITEIYEKLHSDGAYSLPFVVGANYAKEHNGIAILGHMILHNYTDADFNTLNFYDHNHYNDIFNPGVAVNFYEYTLEIAKRMFLDNYGKVFESKVKYDYYGIPYRPKVYMQFSDKYREVFKKICIECNSQYSYCDRIPKVDFLKMLQKT